MIVILYTSLGNAYPIRFVKCTTVQHKTLAEENFGGFINVK